MKTRSDHSGFSAFELVLVIAVVAILGLAGYTVNNRRHNTAAPVATNQAASTISVSTAPTISSANDLDKASQALDQTDPGTANSSDSVQLDSQTSAF